MRFCAGVVIACCMIVRPVPLSSIRWWLSPSLSASLGLTMAQRTAIDQLYRERLASRRRWIEKAVEATDRVDDLLREGADNEATMRETQEAAAAAAEERALARRVRHEIADILSDQQRNLVTVLTSGDIVD